MENKYPTDIENIITNGINRYGWLVTGETPETNGENNNIIVVEISKKFAYLKLFLDFLYNKNMTGKNATKIKPSNLKLTPSALKPINRLLMFTSVLKKGSETKKPAIKISGKKQ